MILHQTKGHCLQGMNQSPPEVIKIFDQNSRLKVFVQNCFVLRKKEIYLNFFKGLNYEPKAKLNCEFCNCYKTNFRGEGKLCSFPCPRVNPLAPEAHFRFSSFQQSTEIACNGFASTLVFNDIKSSQELNDIFNANRLYGLSNMLLKHFLLLEYRVVEPPFLGTLRDRDWLRRIKNMNGYVLVPTCVKNELPIVKAFLKRRDLNKNSFI